MGFDLTAEEKQTITGLKRLAKKWPASLWIYADGDDLQIRRTKPDGSRADEFLGDDEDAFLVEGVAIPNDGGKSGP